MKKRVTLITIAVLLLLTAFLIIVTRLRSPEEVLSPPNPGGEYRQLQQAFESAVGSGTEYKLQYPSEGDFRSAFVLYDLDGDDEQEALVFYTPGSDDSTVRIHVLDYRDDQWVSILDEEGYGGKINSVTFDDLDGSGSSEVILSWSLIGADSSRIMTVHSVQLQEGEKAEFRNLANMPYMAMDVQDLDNDGNSELLVLWNETTQKVQHNYAAVMKMTSNGLHQYGDEAVLDSTASVYSGFHLQEGKTPVVHVDALKGDNSMLTEVLWWDGVGKRLRAPFTENTTNTNLATLRSPAIPTTDIDEDGIYEIPVSVGLPTDTGSSKRTGTKPSAEEEEPLYLTSWSVTGTADPGTLTPKVYSFVNTEEAYALTIPADIRNEILAYRAPATGVVTFYGVHSDGTRDEPLFSLVTKETDALKKSDTYTFRKDQEGKTVFGTLTSAGQKAGYTNEGIENSLTLYSGTKEFSF